MSSSFSRFSRPARIPYFSARLLILRANSTWRSSMILSGTTTFCDMYLFEHDVARAADRSGLRALVAVELIGENWVLFRTAAPRETNPRLLRWLADQGRDVLTLSQMPQSLEEVYLQVVKEDRIEPIIE